MSTENALLTILVDRINNDTLVLPTLPEVAVKVRQAADNPEVNLMDMADVISHDPALSARMIKVANSAFMGRSVKVTNLHQAVTRINFVNELKFPLSIPNGDCSEVYVSTLFASFVLNRELHVFISP